MTAPRPRHPVARAFTTTLIAVLAVAAAAMIPQPRQAPGRAAAPPASQLSGRQRPACPSTMGVRLSVSREPGAVTVTDEDMEATARMVVRAYGYEAQLGAAGAQAPLRLEVSLKLQPGYAEAGAAVVRAGEAGAIATALSADTLPAHAGAVAVGSVLGSALQGALGGLPPCHRVTAFPWMSELQTPAVREAVRRNAAAMARLLRTEDAGLWLVQDSTGQYISSGVLDSFPASISSTNYKTVVPGVSATGEDAIAFSLGRTPVVDGAGPFRVAWVTVPRKP